MGKKIMFKDELEIIKKNLSEHHRNRKEVLIDCVNLKLNQSLQDYYKSMLRSQNVLANRNPIRTIKKMSQESEQDE